MTARIPNPADILPGAGQGIQSILGAVRGGGVPETTLELVSLRVSQINGCDLCVAGACQVLAGRESNDRIDAVASWRETPFVELFDEAERAALALAEAATLLADRPDPVPDAVWDAAAAHYDPTALAALVTSIAMTNLFNRINVTVRQPVGTW